MPTINRIDEFNPDYDTQAALDAGKKRKRGIDELTPGQKKNMGPYGGALAAAAGALAAAPGRAYDAIARGFARGGDPAQPPAAAPTGNPNFGMNDRGIGYTPIPLAPAVKSAPQSVDASTMQTISPVAPTAPAAQPGWDLAGQNARMAAGLQAAANIGTQPGGAFEAGYRGPQAPGRGIAGDFDFATNAAADFAARKGQTRIAKGIGDYITDRDAKARGDVAMKAYADNSLTQAQAGESQQRGILTGVQAADMQATRPGRVDAITAGIGQTKAQTGESLQRTAGAQAMLPGQVTAQGQTTELQGIQLKQAKELDTLRTKALAGDPKATKDFAQYMKANAGKGDGSITEEDIIIAFVNDRKAQAANPNAGAPQSYQEFKAAIVGSGGASPKMVDGQTYKDANGKPFKWVNGKAQAI